MGKQKTALIVGMAKSGVAAARLLYQDNYRIIVNDMKPEIKGLFEQLSGIAYEVKLGANPMDLLDGVDLLIPSPIIPMTRNFIVEAKRRGIEVISEIELGYRYSKADFVCVTGTNGKTTCTALTGELFKAAGRNTFVLGNIGVAISAHALETKPGDVVVAETAALQLEGNVRFHAKAAGVCNITPDHLDHFGTMENYIAAKAKILDNQTADDYAVLNWDDETVRGFSKLTPAHVLYFSRKEEVDNGMFLRNGMLVYRMNGEEHELMRAPHRVRLHKAGRRLYQRQQGHEPGEHDPRDRGDEKADDPAFGRLRQAHRLRRVVRGIYADRQGVRCARRHEKPDP